MQIESPQESQSYDSSSRIVNMSFYSINALQQSQLNQSANSRSSISQSSSGDKFEMMSSLENERWAWLFVIKSLIDLEFIMKSYRYNLIDYYYILLIMSNPTHFSTFTSVITLLITQNPQISSQLQSLRLAIIQWYSAVEQQILNKNRALLLAKTRGNQKLAILFKQIQNFFRTLLKNYSDPNLPIFFKAFLKIKQQFEFIDIDFGKFKEKMKNAETQTEKQFGYVYGIDIDNLIKSFENNKNECDLAKGKIEQLRNENDRLNHHMGVLVDQLNQDRDRYAQQINQLTGLVQKTKADVLVARSQTKKKNNGYRSSPQIKNADGLTNTKIVANLLNRYEQSLAKQQLNDDESDNDASIEQANPQGDLEALRFMYCQALALEGVLTNIEAYNRQAQQ